MGNIHERFIFHYWLGVVLNIIIISSSKSYFIPVVVRLLTDKIVTTIELTMNGNIMDVEPLLAQKPLTLDAKLTASVNEDQIENLRDQDAMTNWHVSLHRNSNDSIYLIAEFDKPVTVSSIVLGRGDKWIPRFNPEFQIPDGNGGWKTVYKWKPKFEPVKTLKQPVKASKFRLLINGTRTFYLAEFELYGE